MTTHKDLEVWKVALDLTDAIYDLTATFPKEELYGLANQMRRACVSIPSNVAEGCGRNNVGELRQFVGIARGSLAELETQLIISLRRHYVTKQRFDEVNALLISVSKLLFRWQESFNREKAA